MKDRWLNDLQNKMSDYEVAPPDGLWDSIGETLERKRLSAWATDRMSLWLRLAGVAAALAVVMPLGRYMDPSLSGCGHVATAVHTAPEQVGGAEALLADARMSETSSTGRYEVAQTPAVVRGQTPQAEERETATVAQDKMPEKEKTDDAAGAAQTSPRQEREFYPDTRRYGQQETTHSYDMVKKKSHTLSVSLFAANIPGRSTTDYGVGVGTLKSGTPLCEEPKTMVRGVHPEADLRSPHQTVAPDVSMKHRQPVRFGVSVSYGFSDRLTLESGLSYTYLSSRLLSSGDDHSFRVRQSLQYVGLPLSLHASLWKNERFNVYLLGGGMMEKCVSGKSESDYIYKGKVKTSTHDRLVEKPLQFSVHAAAGVQVNLSSWIGLYAEPGIGYYFDNGSSVSNIYKEKPLNFNLELGLRFSFGSGGKKRDSDIL